MISSQQFRLKKDGTCYKCAYCAHPELIENYGLAVTDNERTWYCHHKKEEFYTVQELIDLGMYYNVPPEDLVFVRDQEEHKSWPHKGDNLNIGRKRSIETRKKMSEKATGRKHSEEARKKMSKNSTCKIRVRCVETGQVFESITIAANFVGLKSNTSIQAALKNSNRIAAGYHWSIVIGGNHA